MVSIETSGSKKAEFDLLSSVDPEVADYVGSNLVFSTVKKGRGKFCHGLLNSLAIL